ncbi:LOW QUALITY PROTEIN: ATPase family AAA domain-containing protein 5 [Scyliorhinus canicula]|uniref:LOW QUALITY PROTEIN: ATPase family AAA domain-containing protein 5 n=1 Tax=Scyliorhinus canicula TaxID=7830 RepID=UPI0018F729D6|nr:LOW QUALITY PROTEIN: ATPase family AAA domain-containing protein 5 [Scyliorhinus canicula]
MPRRVEIADMVGIIAMAGTVEEYDEPCKKPKKDAEDSSANTITSYFSPLSKSIDTASPSPKSNNIMDYFKKTPSGRNFASNVSGESEGKNSAVMNWNKESSMVSEGKYQTSKGKRLSRRINFSQKLNECHEVAEISDTSNSSVAEACGVRSGVGVLGSDTAALIAQLCAESQELFEENENSVFVDSNTVRRRTKAGNRKKSCKKPVSRSSRKISKKTRKRKIAGNSKDPSRQSDVEPEATDDCCERGVEKPDTQGTTIPVVVESVRMCLSETSLDTTADETCQMNDSTVTVSFEDFIKNQESEESSAEKAAGDDDCEIIEESNKLPNLTEDISSAAPQSISPKTMTVHVQIHSSPTSTSAQNSKLKKKKIASIFLRKKADSESEAVEIQPVSPHPVESTDPAPARRSNVVIAEEELELSVLDATDKSPVKVKCSRAEREQFMNAFRRPLSSDAAKIGLKKAAQKPKTPKEGLMPGQATEGVEEPSVEKGKEECAQVTKAEMSSKGSQDSRTEKSESGATAKKNKKLKRRKVRKAECKSPDDCAVTGEDIDPDLKTCDETTEESRDSKPFDPATTRSSETCRITRRSLRQQRDDLDCSLTPDKAIGVDCLGVPARRTTPKLTRWSSGENSIYKAEMIPMTCNKSPIRMKFIRITRSKSNAKAERMDENAEFTPRSNQRMRRSKNMVKAKRLVEKAKVQSKCRNPVESVAPLRRSTRRQGKSDEKFCGTEDLEIMLHSSAESDSDCIIQCEKKSKNLRNLSDVLRRNPGSTPSTKSTPADLKVASIFAVKKTVKAIPSGPIAIADENSCNGSENSQDDEQFRAKRQFLMSGLPDTLKKHIAKTAAVMEVYSAAGATFQTVVHVQQKSQVSLLWNLAWPNSAILNRLQDVNEGIEGILKLSVSLGDFSEVKYKSTAVATWTGLSNWRTEFSPDIQKCLLDEIRLSNPAFPVRKLFKLLLQKRNEHLAEALKAGSSNKSDSSVIELDAEPQQMLSLCSSPQKTLGKRKRKKERQEQKQKRRKTLDSDEDSVIIIDAEECVEDLPTRPERSTKRNSTGAQKQNCVASSKNRLSRSIKKKQQELECISGAAETQNVPAPPQVSGLTDQTKAEEAAVSDDLVKEDLLWTEKYQPQHSSQLVGNISAVRKLHSWLMEWKKRADQEEKKQKEKKTETDKKLDAWDNSDFNMESSEDEDFLCNTVLITGPPGVGKTAAVYACAQELGFKVFEVNASSQRSGRQILSQLKEATQSHQVDKQGANALKPAFFNSNKLLPSQTAKSPRKANSPKKVISSPRKAAQSPKGRRSKKNLAPMSLTNFFKGLSKPSPNNSEETERPEDKEMDEKPLKNDKAQKSCPQVMEVTRTPSVSDSKDTGPEESSRKSATSLILFEEVDVIFDDDAGFLNAIKTFMATAKRPVILTTTDPNFSLMFECCFEEICFKVPSSANVASYLQLLCLAENLRTDTKDLTALLALNKCDIRQSILHLQFWTKSGGGYHVNKPLPADEEEISTIPSPGPEELVGNAVAAEGTLENSSKSGSIVKTQDVPRCNTGCTENLLGLKHITGCSSDLFSMFKQEIVSLEQWRSQVQILQEFQRRQLDFISQNLEILLPLPVRVVPDPKGPETLTAEDAELPVCNPARTAATLPQGSNASVDASPVKTSRKLKRHRKAVMFDDSDLFDTELNESDTFVTLPNEIHTSPCVVGNIAESQANGVSRDGPSGNKTDCSKVTKKKPRTLAEQKCCESVSLCLGLLAEFTDSISFLDCCLHRGAVEREGTCGQSGYHWAAAEIKNGMLDEGRAESGDWCSSYSFGEMRATVEALSWEKCRSQIQQIMEPSVTKCEEPEKGPMEELALQIPNRQNSNAAITQFSHHHTSTASKRIEVLKTVFSSKAFVSLGNRRASAVDYLPALRTICRTEKLKEQGKLKRRFLHYLDSAHLELPKHILETLATSFP